MASEVVEVQVYVEPGAQAPVQATPGAAGWDLAARIDAPLRINPGDRVTVHTGLWLAIPVGYEGQVRIVEVGSVEALGVTARGEGGFGSTGSGAVVPLSAPAADSVDGQLGLFAAVADRGPMEV